MVEVKVRCRTCNSILGIPSTRCELLLCLDAVVSPMLGFRCPVCGPQLRDDLDLEQMLALIKADVAVRQYLAEKPQPAAVLTYDDLLDFHLTLDAEVAALLDGAA